MPFCRKCGRRLQEYSENCSDCGQSTTSPIINLKKSSSSRLNFKVAAGSKKIARAIVPEKSILTAKTIPISSTSVRIKPLREIVRERIPREPAEVVTMSKGTSSIGQAKNIVPTKTAIIIQTNNAIPAGILTQTKPPTIPKPVLSSKHIVKPKKIKPIKPTAPFTIDNARPIASFAVDQPKIISLTKLVTQSVPVVQPTPTPKVAHVVTSTKPAPPSELMTPAIVYTSHEILKSEVSLKEDFIANPYDYETQTFNFNLKCPNDHFWRSGQALPVSNGKALCPQCGEMLRRPRKNRRSRYHNF